jgi:hypothetical protein
MIEVRRYTAIAADEARSIVLMLGRNDGVIPVNSGPAFTPQEDARRIKGAWGVVSRAGATVPGVVLSIVTLTGNKGDTWLLELGKGTQGSDSLVGLPPCDYPLRYNVGLLVVLGALLTGDLVQIASVYE